MADENTNNPNTASSSSNTNNTNTNNGPNNNEEAAQQQQQMESFQRALKSLQSYSWTPGSAPFPEQAGGAIGLNAALSAGLQLLSRYRLQSRWTENFGLGRLPATSILVPASSSGNTTGGGGGPGSANSASNLLGPTGAGPQNAAMTAVNGLQPACLILLTDGACLTQPPNQGGGSLQLQFGKNTPLKEFYAEPFRWDQRVYCLQIARSGGLPSALRALCEVTGGSYWNLTKHGQLAAVSDQLLQRLLPPLPEHLPLVDPLYLRMPPLPPPTTNVSNPKTPPGYAPGTMILSPADGTFFVNGGPVVCLQALEADVDGNGTAVPPKTFRAMLLYVGSTATTLYFGNAGGADATASTTAGAAAAPTTTPNGVVSPPLWCIPEAFFPSKKLDTLPARKAQPLLLYSKYPANLGSRSFEPTQVIKMLHRLDQAGVHHRQRR